MIGAWALGKLGGHQVSRHHDISRTQLRFASGEMACEPDHRMKWVAQSIAPEPAVGLLSIHGDNTRNRGEVRPGAREISEHDAAVPCIVRDHRKHLKIAIVGVTIIDDLDRRADRVNRCRDFRKFKIATAGLKIAPEANGNLKLKADAAVSRCAYSDARSVHAVLEHDAGNRTVDAAHLLHAL